MDREQEKSKQCVQLDSQQMTVRQTKVVKVKLKNFPQTSKHLLQRYLFGPQKHTLKHLVRKYLDEKVLC